MKIKKQIIAEFWNAVNTEEYFACFELLETPFIKFESQYYRNGNRKIKLIIFNKCWEVYNEFEKDDLDVVEERCIYICKNQLNHAKQHLEDILGET
jgi:hypothetical protein